MSSPSSPTPTPPHTPPRTTPPDSPPSSGVRIKRPRITDEKENGWNEEEKELLKRVKEVQESYSVSITSIHRALSLPSSTLSQFTSFLQGHSTDISWCDDIMIRLQKWLEEVENDDEEEEEEEEPTGVITEALIETSNEDTDTTSTFNATETKTTSPIPTSTIKSSTPITHTSTSPINLTLRSRLITLRTQHTFPLPGICLSISTSHIPPSRDILIQETAGLQAWLEWKEGDPWTRDEAWTHDMESRLETWLNAYENKHREHDTSSASSSSLPSTSTPPPPSLSIPPLPTFTPLELTERQSTWEHQLHLMSQHMDLPLRDMINAYLTQQHYDTSNVVRQVLHDVDMNELVRHRMNFIAWLTFPNLTYQHSFTSAWITAWQPLIRYWLQQQMSHVDDDVDGDGIVLEDDEMDEEAVVEESTTTTTSPSPSTKKKTTTPKQATTKLHASTLAIFDIPLHTSLRTYLTSLPSIDFATSTYHMASTLSPTYCHNFTLDKHSYYSKNYIRWNYDEMIKPQFSIEWVCDRIGYVIYGYILDICVWIEPCVDCGA